MKNYYLILNIHNPYKPTVIINKGIIKKFNREQANKYVTENTTFVNPLVALEIKNA